MRSRRDTAIREADFDGNPDTIADPNWTPLLSTPAFPEYVSGHSTFSAAAATVLARFFGTDSVSFTVGSDSVPGVMRSYLSFAAAADEIGLSRIYGGIPFLSADLDGLSMGHTIGEYVERNFLLPIGEPPAIREMRSTNGNIEFRVDGTAGCPAVLESSATLHDWIPVSTNNLPFQFQEVFSGSIRFYRAKLLR